ncbi:MAG TPA: hypothetical protein ENK77_03870 [Epsilonproteobacteria bacterium]|nr:hypothetical protein [Campylobacterota bacterium]HHH37735.1 hypothetical protein [Campylobacterota bacterium]
MIWKRYRNELFIVVSFLLMLTALLYKNSAADRLDSTNREVKVSVTQIGKIAALKKQWGSENLSKKIEKIKTNIAPDKIKQFTIKQKKLFASFAGLSAMEMNTIILKLENIAVQITKLSAKRQGESYSLEVTCKW